MWKPADIIRVVVVVLGFMMFAVGIVMMWQEISVEGAIDIRSSFMSGSIQTGSAGILVCFLAFCLISFCILSPNSNEKAKKAVNASNTKSSTRLGWGLLICLVLCAVCGAAGALGHGEGFGLLAAFFGFSVLVGSMPYFSMLENGS